MPFKGLLFFAIFNLAVICSQEKTICWLVNGFGRFTGSSPTVATATVTVLFIVCAHLSQLRQTEIVNCFATAGCCSRSCSTSCGRLSSSPRQTWLDRRTGGGSSSVYFILFASLRVGSLFCLAVGWHVCRVLFCHIWHLLSAVSALVCFWPINEPSLRKFSYSVAFNGAFNISFGRHCPSNSMRRISSTWFSLVSRLCCWLVVLACVNFNWLSVHWGKF